jgi:hypothetical protein
LPWGARKHPAADRNFGATEHERITLLLLRGGIEDAEIEEVCIGVIAVDFQNFGDESPARPPFDLHDNIKRISNVRPNGAVRKLDAALQDAARESGDSLFCRARMDCGQGSGMAGIEKLQQIERFTAPDFPKQQPIRPVAERGFEKITDGNGGRTALFTSRFKSDKVFMAQLNLGRVLDE